ncbi:hypothetical protein NFI96_025607 [Prochilodus magdalenae]|nr:hypothetical protein NFI96_025607 [Prochilodus magdalenae]
MNQKEQSAMSDELKGQGKKDNQEKKAVMIEENGVRVSVTLLNEAANEEFERGRDIVITHVKVDKTWGCGKKLTSSDLTDVFATFLMSHIERMGEGSYASSVMSFSLVSN